MARPLRIQYEGAFYHVISRGNGGSFLYRSDKEKEHFIELLGKGAERYEVEVYAYCVLGTHYHLLIQTLKANLSGFMHYLGSSYANYAAYMGWKGHVFAGRYKSVCIEKEEYFLTVSRYIHLNPVKAGLVVKPQDYRWSSYRHYAGGSDAPEWLRQDWLKEYFGDEDREARRLYCEFVESACDDPPQYPKEKVVAQAILGSEKFVDMIKVMIKDKIKPNETTGLKYLVRELSLRELYDAVCRHYGLSDLEGEDGRKPSALQRARKAFIYLAREYTPATNGEIAGMLSDVSPNAVSRRYSRIKGCLDEGGSSETGFRGELVEIMSHVRG